MAARRSTEEMRSMSTKEAVGSATTIQQPNVAPRAMRASLRTSVHAGKFSWGTKEQLKSYEKGYQERVAYGVAEW
jgi:hypothetical protein